MKAYGTRVTFRIMGAAAFCSATVYFLTNCLYIIPKHRRQEKEKAVPDPQNAVDENGADKGEQNDNSHVNAGFTGEKGDWSNLIVERI